MHSTTQAIMKQRIYIARLHHSPHMLTHSTTTALSLSCVAGHTPTAPSESPQTWTHAALRCMPVGIRIGVPSVRNGSPVSTGADSHVALSHGQESLCMLPQSA